LPYKLRRSRVSLSYDVDLETCQPYPHLLQEHDNVDAMHPAQRKQQASGRLASPLYIAHRNLFRNLPVSFRRNKLFVHVSVALLIGTISLL